MRPSRSRTSSLAEVIERALSAGQESVRRGPDLLPILREAGVVDAGGYGLTVLFAGIVGALRGSAPVELAHHAAARITHPHHSSSTFRYCTNFAVTGTELDQRHFIRELERIGDSVLVVGDATTLKVHVHTDDPDAATALAGVAGAVSHIDIADMTEQVARRDARLRGAGGVGGVGGSKSNNPATNGDARAGVGNGARPAERTCGALAVVTGDGFKELYASLGVGTLDAGPKLNPSTSDLLAAIHGVPAEQIIVLPNSSNVQMAAERAAELSDRTVEVVASGRCRQGWSRRSASTRGAQRKTTR